MIQVKIVYGTSWCFGTRRSREYLDEHGISYQYIDIDFNQEGEEFVLQTNNGKRKVPTILFSDNTILASPSNEELGRKIGIE